MYNDIAVKIKEIECLPKCIIHSDIKKENILVNKKKVYIIDFGNCFIGPRLIDIIRVIMWLFIFPDEEVNYSGIDEFCKSYFKYIPMSNLESKLLPVMIDYCLLYNYAKDKYLCSNGILTENYVNKTSTKWFNVLNRKDTRKKILEVIQND